jgi:hypothetical protein
MLLLNCLPCYNSSQSREAQLLADYWGALSNECRCFSDAGIRDQLWVIVNSINGFWFTRTSALYNHTHKG